MISKELDHLLTIVELAALRTRDKHRQFAAFTTPDQWWDTFAKEIAELAADMRADARRRL
jgi:hypothetical protein